ncbi:hypothetical protein Vadar_014911 [Vaccinium darrowii]|uniref:Uncharacterized protein n=1 Tax=Vaccinium darrowii TaxID=229202 RepID=A0ACB7XHL9_9ERIC|nr:hypothetical protein Vadar_014911 [Vaccinium darrowii]
MVGRSEAVWIRIYHRACPSATGTAFHISTTECPAGCQVYGWAMSDTRTYRPPNVCKQQSLGKGISPICPESGFSRAGYTVHGGLLLSTGGFSTGFIVSDEGHIMTCAHCPGDERQYRDDLGIVRNSFLVFETFVKFLDRDISPVRVSWSLQYPSFDVAILKTPSFPEAVKSYTVSFSGTAPQIGDSCFVTGHPSVEFATRCGVVSSLASTTSLPLLDPLRNYSRRQWAPPT